MKKLVIFDLDGTLLNTLGDLAASCNYLMEQHGYPTHPLDRYRYLVGNGINKLIERALPAGESSPERAAALRPEFIARVSGTPLGTLPSLPRHRNPPENPLPAGHPAGRSQQQIPRRHRGAGAAFLSPSAVCRRLRAAGRHPGKTRSGRSAPDPLRDQSAGRTSAVRRRLRRRYAHRCPRRHRIGGGLLGIPTACGTRSLGGRPPGRNTARHPPDSPLVSTPFFLPKKKGGGLRQACFLSKKVRYAATKNPAKIYRNL